MICITYVMPKWPDENIAAYCLCLRLHKSLGESSKSEVFADFDRKISEFGLRFIHAFDK